MEYSLYALPNLLRSCCFLWFASQAKIADFGLLRRLNEEDGEDGARTRIAGTPGYVDPDYTRTNRVTTKTDVYW